MTPAPGATPVYTRDMTHAAGLLETLEAQALRGTPLERALYAALRSTAPLGFVSQPWPGAFVIHFPEPACSALLLTPAAAEKPAELAALVRQLAPGGLEICVCGGDDATLAALNQAMPTHMPRAVTRMRVDAEGPATALGSLPLPAPPLWKALMALPPADALLDWPGTLSARAPVEERLRHAAQEQQAFGQALQGRRAPVTRVLLGVLAAVFAVELWLGPSVPVWALRRLGAMDTDLLLAGEWWRAVAPTFLHGGPLHLALNGMVLWTLGSPVERTLGSARFVLLYGLSGLAGALISAWSLRAGGVSVGASGALWGVMTAQAMLVFLPTSPLPALMRARSRSAVLQNLVVNAVVSFQPHVDWAAHLGGGAVGALLMLLGLGSVPPPRAGVALPQDPRWLKGAAASLVGLFAVGLGTALWHAELPQMLQRWQWTAVAVTAAQLEVEVPAVAASPVRVVPAQDGHPAEAVLGDLGQGPVTVVVTAQAREARSPAERRAEVESVMAMQRERSDAALKEGPASAEQGDTTVVTVLHTLPNGLPFQTAWVVAAGFWVRVEVAAWPDDPRPGLAAEVASRVRVLPTPDP